MQRARWIEEGFYELWREGVSAIAWFLLADQPPVPSYAATYQSGLYFEHGRLKPGIQAFRFPFVVEPAAHGRKRIWGFSPGAGTVSVEIRRGGRWRRFARFHERSHGVFTETTSLGHGSLLRAQIGSQTSYSWRVG